MSYGPHKHCSLGDWDYGYSRDGRDFDFELYCMREGCPSADEPFIDKDLPCVKLRVETYAEGPDPSVGYRGGIEADVWSPLWAMTNDAWRQIRVGVISACLCGNYFPEENALKTLLDKIAEEVVEDDMRDAAEAAAEDRYDRWKEGD